MARHRQFRELPPIQISRARKLRTNLTDAERKLWRHLRLRQLEGYKFRRQYPVGKYIADFACIEHKLIIELDGGHHDAMRHYDKERDSFLQKQGYTVLRFWNNDVMRNTEGVVETILRHLC